LATEEIVVFGLSHHGTPLALRERLASPAERVPDELKQLLATGSLGEGVLLSTCNRIELIGTSAEAHRARECLLAHWNARAGSERVDAYVYEHRGTAALRHLFRVAAGLDSMVLGEPQILGQVKEAFALASDSGSVGPLLGRCFDRTFSVAKRVRTGTSIAAGNVSVSSIACELAEQIFGDLVGRKVLLVGAGKMSEAAARSLTARGATLTVVNRSQERAEALAQASGGQARPLEALATELAAADVVISSTAKDGFIITYDLMQGVVKMRKWRQLFLIDIAVPRDIDPRVEGLRNVFLYDMDDLQRVSRENIKARERAAHAAEAIVDEEVADYERWLRTLELTPTIVALRERVRAVVHGERHKLAGKLTGLSAQHERALEAMCDSIVNQLLHAPLTELKRSQKDGDGAALVHAVQRLFKLDPASGTAVTPVAEDDPALQAAPGPNRRTP
jgi:glutamyl-tRNA reductase